MKTVGLKAQPCTATAVAERCRAAGWTLEPAHAEKLAVYLELLMRWNRAMNLVGAHSWVEILERLVLDSFELARFLNREVPPERTESVLGQDAEAAFPSCWDLGAGAGLPGIPLRIVWERGEYWFVEAREKRALFLSTVLARISLPGTHVFRGRAEAFMPGRQADLVLSRAFMPWREVLALVRNHIAPGGRVILLTREAIDADELDTGVPETDWRMTASGAYQIGPDTRRLYALTAGPD